MMQIFVYAIEESLTGKPQYVFSKGLDWVRTDDKEYVRLYVKEGYTFRGKFINGVGEYTYVVIDSTAIDRIKFFIENKLKKLIDVNFDFMYLNFQEFFQPKTCKSEELKLAIHFWRNGESKPDIMYFNNEEARKISDYLTFCRKVEQDEEGLLKTLETIKKGATT